MRSVRVEWEGPFPIEKTRQMNGRELYQTIIGIPILRNIIRTTIVIFVLLLMGCAIPPSPLESEPEVQIPESQFMGQYPSLVGQFKADYPNLKELSGSYHGDAFKYIMPDGKILTARKDRKKGVWNISIRQPYQGDVQTIMERGVAW